MPLSMPEARWASRCSWHECWTSTVQTSHSDVSKPHQRLTSSGVVHVLKIRSAGASKTRVMRISVSDGRVMTAEP